MKHLSRAAEFRVFALVAAILLVVLGLTATVHAAPPVGTVTVTVNQPTVGFRAAGALPIRASMTSTYEIMNVHAVVGTVEIDLTPPVPPSIEWTGQLPVTSLPHGEQTLVLTATDAFGTTGQASRVFIHDEDPVVRWNLPEYPTVLRGPFTIQVTCEDDDPLGCADLRLSSTDCNFVVTSSTGTITYELNLESATCTVAAVAFLTRRSVVISTKIHAEQGDHLEEVMRVEGDVLDYDGSRLLYRALPSQRAHLIEGGLDSDIGDAQAYYPARGRLTTGGAAWVSVEFPDAGPGPQCSSTRNEQFYSFQSGVTKLLGSCRGFEVAGDYGFLGPVKDFDLIHLPTGETLASGPRLTSRASALADNGDLFFLSDPAHGENLLPIERLRDGEYEPVGFIPKDINRLVTDGESVAASSAGSIEHPLFLFRPGEDPVTITGGDPRNVLLSQGWMGFNRQGVSTSQVWVRSPEGEIIQMSYFSVPSLIETIGGEGEVTFMMSGVRYYAAPGVPAFPVSKYVGRSYYSCGAWFIALGDTVLRILGTVDSESEGCHVPGGGGGTGGASGTGGDSGSGGATSSGGDTGSGGVTGSDGGSSSGGTGSGGIAEPSSGGTSSEGGSSSTGGAVSTGGTVSTGGASTGGPAGGTSSGMGGDDGDDSGPDGGDSGGGCSVSSSGGRFDPIWVGAFALLAFVRNRSRRLGSETRKVAA